MNHLENYYANYDEEGRLLLDENLFLDYDV